MTASTPTPLEAESRGFSGRTALFIDGDSLNSSLDAIRRERPFKYVDYRRKLPAYFGQGRMLLRSFYYSIEDRDPGPDASPDARNAWIGQQKFLFMLKRSGYRVRTRLRKGRLEKTGQERHRSTLDLDLAIDMLMTASFVDEVVLISGDGEFTGLIEAVGNRGVRTRIVSLWRSPKEGGATAPELLEVADEFLDLGDIIESITLPLDG